MQKKKKHSQQFIYLHAKVVHEQVYACGIVLARSILAHADVYLTVSPGPSLRTHALEAAHLVYAHRIVQARIGLAVVDVDLARRAGIAFAAMADEGVVEVHAAIGTSRTARVAEALIDLRLALQPDVAGSTFADESLQLIQARGAVLARIRCAVVDRMLALLAGVARLAGAGIIANLVDALAVISARFRGALIDVGLASCAGPSRMTDAIVTEELVHADSVETRIARAQVDLLVAAFAGESGRTITGEVGDQVSAVGAEQTRSFGTIVGVDFAALTFPSWQAIALVAALLKGHARRTVVARISARCTRIYLRKRKIKSIIF